MSNQNVTPSNAEIVELTNKMQMQLDKANIRLMQSRGNVFLQTMLFQLNHIPTSSVETIATDGLNLFFNPNAILELTPDELAGKFADIALHVGLKHATRAKRFENNEADFKKYVKACSLANNLSLTNNGFKLPSDHEIDPDYNDMTEDAIYQSLPDDEKDDNDSSGAGWDSSDIMTPPSQAESEMIEAQVDEMLSKAVKAAELAGGDSAANIPGEALRRYQELTASKHNWTDLLADWVSGFGKNDFSYKRVNYTYYPDFLSPTLYSEDIEKVLVFIDVSGSIGQEELDFFFSEIQGLRQTYPVSDMRIIGFDTRLTVEHEVNSYDESISVDLLGGGGTNITPVLNKIHEEKPEFALIFTDGYFYNYLPDGYDTPTLWLIHDNPSFDYEFGKVVHHDIIRS